MGAPPLGRGPPSSPRHTPAYDLRRHYATSRVRGLRLYACTHAHVCTRLHACTYVQRWKHARQYTDAARCTHTRFSATRGATTRTPTHPTRAQHQTHTHTKTTIDTTSASAGTTMRLYTCTRTCLTVHTYTITPSCTRTFIFARRPVDRCTLTRTAVWPRLPTLGMRFILSSDNPVRDISLIMYILKQTRLRLCPHPNLCRLHVFMCVSVRIPFAVPTVHDSNDSRSSRPIGEGSLGPC